MSNQLRLAALLRQAASALTNTSDANTTTSSGSSESGCSSTCIARPLPSPSSQNPVQAAVRTAFAPYRQSHYSYNRRRATTVPVSYWSHRFCVIQSCSKVGFSESFLRYINENVCSYLIIQ